MIRKINMAVLVCAAAMLSANFAAGKYKFEVLLSGKAVLTDEATVK